MKNRSRAAGPAARRRGGRHAGRHFRKQSRLVSLSGENARRHATSRRASRGNCRGTRPWRGRGPSPQAGPATDGEKADRGRHAEVEASSQSCGPDFVELQGASIMHHAVWNGVRARLLWRLSRLAVPESERRSNTAPREIQGGCGKRRAFHAVLVVDCFLTLESKFCNGHTISHTLRGP